MRKTPISQKYREKYMTNISLNHHHFYIKLYVTFYPLTFIKN